MDAGSSELTSPFPPAAQPNLIRAQQKDELYLQYLTDACHDAVRRLLGPYRALRWAGETRALAHLLYLAQTTGSGLQTLGEEYCDILQVAGRPPALPTAARRGIVVLLEALGPYLADRLTGVGDDGGAAWQSRPAMAAATQLRQPSSLVSLQQEAASASAFWHLSTLYGWYMRTLRDPVVRNLASVSALVKEHGLMLLRVHLAFFYIFGVFYQPIKRLSGIRYLYLGRLLEGKPSYRFLGVLLLMQLGVSGLLWAAKRFSLLSWAAGFPAAGEGSLHRSSHAALLTANGKLVGEEMGASGGSAPISASTAASDTRDLPGNLKCPLCLSARIVPTATPCGHVFCWQCITEWGNQKPECPLCRAAFAPSSLVCVRHADF